MQVLLQINLLSSSTIDKNLSWSEHIKQITKKANNVKCLLQRNYKQVSPPPPPPQTKSNYYKALVKPILEYASTVWSPHTQRDIDATARFVTNNYFRYTSVTKMLSNLSWSTLTRCRNEQKARMLYKIINCQV